VTYRLDLDELQPRLGTLPVDALLPLQEMWSFLEPTPWAGGPWRGFNPEGARRFVLFGEGRGTIIYLILEDQQIVDVLNIIWV
jgi:hypothetical protein